ncbi:patatin-like phospholipase family protein [Methylobacterium sp. A52T]
MSLSKRDHLDPDYGPKRILSIDGGGVRGMLTLQFLKRVEIEVRKRLGDGALLCDYFDLIGGTSTGSIIAAGLACGMTVGRLEALYENISADVFRTGGFTRLLPNQFQGKLAPKFPTEPLQHFLDQELGADTTLDSDKIRTGLMIMTKRLDTGSPWPLHNGGRGAFAEQDGKLRLTQIIRASTAAPTYFAPEKVRIASRGGDTIDGAFVDGGVTPFNDPAWQLLMLATLQGHGFQWRTGRNELLIISIGTGHFSKQRNTDDIISSIAATQGIIALQTLMDDCGRINRATLQWMTHCLTPSMIDRAVGDMRLDSTSGPQLATYVRYNILLEQNWLRAELDRKISNDEIDAICRMDDPANLHTLAELGQKAAEKFVKPNHMPAAFDFVRRPMSL